MKTPKLRITPLLAALAGLSAFSAATFLNERDARAVGQSTGRVTGTVIEQATQAPVPGANVNLSGGSGVKMHVQTQEDGSFEISPVPPGDYDLVLSYEGMKPVKRKVHVNPDAATPVNIVWSAESVQEETTVVEEERHLTNPDSPQTGTIVSMDRANRLPIARQYQSISTQVPGVTVGGGNPNVKGARSNNNRYLVNGLDLTDPVTNTFSANFQQDALESVEVRTGGFEAKYNALGSIVAVQTRRGTNKYHGAASAYWAPAFLVDYDTFGAQTYDGTKPWDYSSERPAQGRYELNLTNQGPIIKDHLFYNVGIQYNRSNAAQPAGPPRFVQAPSRVFISYYITAGITFVPVNEHRIHTEFFADPTTIDYENNDGTGANSSTPYSQAGRTQGGHRATMEWAWQANKHVATKVLLGYGSNSLNVGPQGLRTIADKDLINGVKYDFKRPLHFNQDDSTQWFNTNTHDVTTRRRYQLDASVTANGELGGKHEAEFGVQTAFTEQRRGLTFSGGTSGQDDATGYGVSYSDRGGGPLDRGLCDVDPALNPGAVDGNYTGAGCFRRTYSRSFAAHQSGNTFGVYVQDRYKPRKWLTILPGTRWDVGTVRATNSEVAFSASGFGPRLSVMADLTGDQKTIAQISYGRMTEMPTLASVSGYDGARRNQSVIEQYDAASRRFQFFTTSGGPQGTRLRFDRQSASADEILLSLRREFAKGVLGRVDYTYRYLRRQFEGEEVNAIMDPTGSRTIGFRNGIPIRVFESGFNPKSTAQYSGVDLILEGRSENLEIQGSYTLSQSWGTAGNGGATGVSFDNLRYDPFYHAYTTGVDTRHQIKTSTTYTFLGGFALGLILNWRSGVALTKTYPGAEGTSAAGGYAIRRAPTGYEPGAYYNTGTGNPYQLGTFSDVRSWTEFRSPDLFTINMMLSYDFHKLLKEHIILNVQVNNVLALTTPTSVGSTEGAPNTNQSGLAAGRQGFRTVTLGARYEF
jgi:hypothetical protein